MPSHRGKGLAAQLCREVFQFLVHREGTETPSVLVPIVVKPENTATIHLYDQLGFEKIGLCSLEEALRVNGDGRLLLDG